MKLFTKLALVSAIAISGQAMAMESLDDAALSSATGQEGITIGLGLDHIAIGSIYVHDNDGLSETATDYNGNDITGGTGVASTTSSGAITITGNGISGDRNETAGIDIKANPDGGLVMQGSQPLFAKLDIDSDAGDSTKGGAFLNINAAVSGLDIAIGNIGVAKSKATVTGATRGIEDNSNNVLITGLNLKTGLTTANIQLGNTPQGEMINLNGTMQGGLTIENLGLKDNGLGGTIQLDSIHVADNGGTDLTTNATVGVSANGLVINAMATPIDVYVKGIHLGSAAVASIGDVEISNMAVSHGNTAGAVIFVSGH